MMRQRSFCIQKNMRNICFFHFTCSETKWVIIRITKSLYQDKSLEPGVQTVVNNKVKFEPYDDLLYDVYSHYNVDISDNQDPCG